MSHKPITGFEDKLYWRPVSSMLFHCFEKNVKTGEFESLCFRAKIERSNGQHIGRPRAELRCGRCDSEEMKMRGWDESGPQTEENPLIPPGKELL